MKRFIYDPALGLPRPSTGRLCNAQTSPTDTSSCFAPAVCSVRGLDFCEKHSPETRLRELRRMLDQYPGQQGGLQAIAEELYRMARSTESFKCAARSANTGANDPQECDWPFCGCDPYADKVIAEIQEAGFTLVKDEDLLKMSSIHSEPESEPCDACGKPDGINHTYDCPEAQQ